MHTTRKTFAKTQTFFGWLQGNFGLTIYHVGLQEMGRRRSISNPDAGRRIAVFSEVKMSSSAAAILTCLLPQAVHLRALATICNGFPSLCTGHPSLCTGITRLYQLPSLEQGSPTFVPGNSVSVPGSPAFVPDSPVFVPELQDSNRSPVLQKAPKPFYRTAQPLC